MSDQETMENNNVVLKSIKQCVVYDCKDIKKHQQNKRKLKNVTKSTIHEKSNVRGSSELKKLKNNTEKASRNEFPANQIESSVCEFVKKEIKNETGVEMIKKENDLMEFDLNKNLNNNMDGIAYDKSKIRADINKDSCKYEIKEENIDDDVSDNGSIPAQLNTRLDNRNVESEDTSLVENPPEKLKKFQHDSDNNLTAGLKNAHHEDIPTVTEETVNSNDLFETADVVIECKDEAGVNFNLDSMMDAPSDNEYDCNFCEFKADTLFSLKFHMSLLHGLQNYTCDECPCSIDDFDDFMQHLRIHKPYQCDYCPFKTPWKTDFNTHSKTHTEIPFKCDVCKFESVTFASLNTHKITHLTKASPNQDESSDAVNLQDLSYTCRLCSYTTKRSNNLKQHMRVHTGERPYSCKLCSLKFSRKSYLEAHMPSHTGEKIFKCDQCPFESFAMKALKYHLYSHQPRKLYVCLTCPYSNDSLSNVRFHMKVHTSEKPYHCPHCNYKTSYKSHINTHIKIHTGEKPFKCNQCPYQALNITKLKIHRKTHTKNKNNSKLETIN